MGGADSVFPQLTSRALDVVCDPVTQGDDVGSLILSMEMVMTNGRGVGLAANQIGVTKRVIIVHTQDFRQVFLNPVIVKRYGGMQTSREGCLSFPGKTAVLVRHKRVIVEAYKPDWTPIRRKLKGLAAIVVQHEVDHLDGITCMQRATKVIG